MSNHITDVRSWRKALVVLAISIILVPSVASAQLLSEEDKLGEVEALSDQVSRLYEEQNYDAAIQPAERLLGIIGTLDAPYQPIVASALNKAGMLFHRKGDYPGAQKLYLQSLGYWEWWYWRAGLEDNKRGDDRELSPSPPEAASVLANLAALCIEIGDDTRAEEYYQKGLKSIGDALGPNHPDAVPALNDLAALYKEKGGYARAEDLYRKSLKIAGPDHPDMAAVLNNLGSLYQAMGDYTRAEEYYRKSFKIYKDAPDLNQPDVAAVLNNLGTLYQAMREYTRAEKFYRKCLKMTEDAPGFNQLEVAGVLNRMASLYRDKRDFIRAEECCRRSLRIQEDVLDPNHPEVAATVQDLAALSLANGKIKDTTELLTRAGDIDEYNVGHILLMGSEDQKKLYMNTLTYRSDFNIAFHLKYARSNPAAVKLAITSILRRKGRVLQAMRDSYAALSGRLDEEDRKTLGELRSVREEISTLYKKGPGKAGLEPYQNEFNRLTKVQDRLEQEMSLRSDEVRLETRPVRLEEVQQAIPKNAALVEISTYRPYDVKADTWGEPRYAAYVLWSDRMPACVDLGEAPRIDQAVAKLRRALGDSKRSDVKVFARALDKLTMQRIRHLLGNIRTVLLSPDGALNLVPFSALVDEKNQYLLARKFSFIYLTSGRDLLWMQTKTKSKSAPVIIANPNYTLYGVDRSKKTRWDTLALTKDEAKALKDLLPGATVWEWGEATEEALKKVHGPEILHVATHGFFNDQSSEEETPVKAGKPAAPRSGNVLSPPIDNPRLRSGLVLAGADSPPKWDRENGVVTALEIASLDLWGTRLVVLSACETGLGDVQTGEGVYGLRRSLVLAGSESQVISLWKVLSSATQDLMVAYYGNLKAGEGRSAALLKVQRQLMGSKDRSHPYYWASFITSGDWRAIDWETREAPQALGESAVAQASTAPETATTPSPDKGNPTGEKAGKPRTSKGASSGIIFGKVVRIIIDEDIIVVDRDNAMGQDAYEIKEANWTGHYKSEKDMHVGDMVAVKYVTRKGKKVATEVMALSRVAP